MSHQQYIIIGLGVCGTAAALQLLRTKTCCTLTIISHHRPSEPSNDISKIVRIDYAEKERIEEASRAQHHWMNDEQFKTFYQPVGRIVAYEDGDGTLAGIDAARSELQLPRRERWDINILNKYYGHTRASANLHYIWNEDDGLVEWKGCMEALRSYIHQHKATRIVHGQAERLYHDAGRIRTISVDGRSIDVNDAQVILAAGPWISEMMDQSEISQPPSLRVPVATGVFACFVQLDEEQRQFFRGKPAFSHIGYAEFLPPTCDDGLAKITRILPFTNKSSGSQISRPRDVSESLLAVRVMLELKDWMLKYIPRLKGAKIVRMQSYWDGMTHSQDPLIDKHPDYDNLFVFGGLSYTRAKDLTILGTDFGKVLDGKEINPFYGWSPPLPGRSHQPRLLAEDDFDTLELEAKTNTRVNDWQLSVRPQADHLDIV